MKVYSETIRSIKCQAQPHPKHRMISKDDKYI